MKKLLLAVVLPLAATSVYAETSVTLYGGADGGITVQKLKGKSATVRFANGSLDTNMFGFTGTEDLGSGNNVFLRLEQGYVLSNGKEDDDKGDRPLIVRLTWVLKAASARSHSAESEHLVPTTANTPFPVPPPTTRAFRYSAISTALSF